jgi:gamma-glutamyltranspeptidase/glutathione hydrolase
MAKLMKLPAGEPMLKWLQPGGKDLSPTTRIVRPELAETITRFGKGGRDAFYKGEVAADLVAAVKARGGVLTAEDLASYQPIWREPLVGQFRGRKIFAAPPPAGGTTALEALHFLDALPALPKGSLGSSAYFHRISEALTHAFADRARWMGDPAFFTDGEVPMQKLATPEYGKQLAARFHDESVPPNDSYGTPAKKGSPVEPPRDHGTSHLCVMDGEGNVVALTTTVNMEFGAQMEAPRSGVVLNDQMDDFASRPGKPNGFGLVGAEANSIAPGKRPLSSMTPMIVVDKDEAVMCVGGSGGPTIVASSVQAIVAAIDEGVNAEVAVTMPRVYSQWRPDVLMLETDIPTDVANALAKRGHKLKRLESEIFAPAIQVTLRKNGEIEAASDPRKGGAPAAP